MILAVDPGRATGWALFYNDGTLARAGVCKPKEVPNAIVYDVLVIEKSHGGKGKASRTNIAMLGRRMQMVIDRVTADRVEEVVANKWKGTTDGDIKTRQIETLWLDTLDRLTFAAQKIAKSLAHNALDAYGLGRWWFAKEGGREIPR